MGPQNLSMLVRQFSTNNAVQQLVKAPIQVFGVEGRYATALYSAATKQKNLDKVEKDLLKLQQTIKTDQKLKEFIANPVVKRPVKAEAIKSIASKMTLTPQTANLLLALGENGRLKNVDSIINAFKTIMAAHRGEVTCEVTTAKPLDGPQKQKLETVLKSFVQGKETINLTVKVDPQLVGGMIVSIGDRYVDMSVASKIKKYSNVMSMPL